MQPNDQNPTDGTDKSLPVDENTNPTTTPSDVTPDSTVSAPEVPGSIQPKEATASQEPTVFTPDAPSDSLGEASPVAAAPVAATDTPNPVTETTPSGSANPTEPASVGSSAAPVVAGVVGAASVSGSQGTPKKGKKKLILLVAVIAAIILLAGTVGAYFGIYLPNQPQKITGDALANTVNSEKLKSTKFEGEVAFSGGEVSKVISSVGFEGALDSEKEAVDLKVSVNTAVTKVNLDLRSTDGKSAYIRVSGLEGLDQLLAATAAGSTSPNAAAVSQFAPLLAQVNGKWFMLDESLLKQASGSEGLGSGEKITSADAEQIGKLYKKHQFLNIDKRLADENIHGVASYHVQATVNKDELKAFLEELKSANIKSLKLEQKDIDEISKVDFSKYPLEMWVSKKNRFLTQVSTSFEDKGTTYKVRVALKDINQPVTVEKPADARSILELLGGLYGGQGVLGASSDTSGLNSLLMGL